MVTEINILLILENVMHDVHSKSNWRLHKQEQSHAMESMTIGKKCKLDHLSLLASLETAPTRPRNILLVNSFLVISDFRSYLCDT